MPTQDDRLIAIDTPLGKDALLLQSFAGTEGMSELFRFELDLLSENQSLTFKDIVGQRVTIRLSSGGTDRHINGFVSRFAQSGRDERFAYYHAEVVPWLWFLTRKADCRIFQEKSVPEIVTGIFDELGFSDHSQRLSQTYPPRSYCVQYRETNFNFVSRLLEECGISYFFEHEEGKHTLVLADSADAHPGCPGQSTLTYQESAGGAAALEPGVVTGWHIRQELKPGKHALLDYNFETPSVRLLSNIDSTVKVGGNEAFEVFDFPGEYAKQDEGDGLVRVRMEEEEAFHFVISGDSNCRSLTAGCAFELEGHYREDANQKYTLTAVRHHASVGAAYQTGEGVDETYSNDFTCIPNSTTHRPPRRTRTPVVHGVQSAVVVGKAGEDIWTDKYGRVKVQFHWDREGKKDENSSCWVRVSQPWAGKGWGTIAIPRIGQEVIVDFLEGDPDRPIITGRVYNAELMPPYDLPANQTRSGTVSRSSKGGAGSNCNEIRLEDKKGAEQLLVHAERNYDLEVEADETHSVGHDETHTVKNNQDLTVDVDRTVHVKGAFDETIDGGETRTVTGGIEETVTGDVKKTVTGGVTHTFTGALEQTVVGGVKVTTPATFEVTAAAGVKIIAPAGVQVVAPGGQTQVDSFWTQTGGANHTAFASRVSVSGTVGQTFAVRSAVRGVDSRNTALKIDTVGVLMDQKGVEVFKKASSIGQKALCCVTFGFYSIM